MKKSQAFKMLIKEAVREVIQEELREVLMEAVRAPKQSTPQFTPQPTPSLTMEDRREKYRNILGETAQQFTTQNAPFNPQGTMPGSDLPAGELNMDQIMSLINR